MKDRKIVFFDIDGTLWDENNRIPQSTKEAIKKLRENGHLAFINTGRSRSFVRNPKLFHLGFDGIVSGCGTRVEYDGNVIFYYKLDTKLAERTINKVREFDFRPILEGVDYLYMDEVDFPVGDFYGDKLREEMGKDLLSIEDTWGEWEISKLSCATPPEQIENCYEAVKDDFDFMVHSPTVVEMVPKGFHKGVGIKKVCELLGVPEENTFAIGDSINDLEMLEAAGVSICMGNGTDNAKEAADYVTTDLFDDGIKNALEHFSLI
ncbi:MAG: Cof-type HAD-IIB family hydrolase [Lachnospiraceae bacterium]|nr:Cof-type HAD-IIB family hydrolase [Lachnospiraceae bacterium]